jgi:hypothetical protein
MLKKRYFSGSIATHSASEIMGYSSTHIVGIVNLPNIRHKYRMLSSLLERYISSTFHSGRFVVVPSAFQYNFFTCGKTQPSLEDEAESAYPFIV